MSGARRCRGGCLLWACGRELGHAGPCAPATSDRRAVRAQARQERRHAERLARWAKRYDDLNGRPEGGDDR